MEQMFYPSSAVVGTSDDEHDDDVVLSEHHTTLAIEQNHGLLQALNSIESTGNIGIFGHYPLFPNPGLTIEGDNLIPLPLKKDDAQIIKAVCRQAPFGHGDKTIVDTSIRNTWELDASRFDLKNPEWAAFFDEILQNSAAGLGLGKVVASPYKLLLYESGSFFKPHKDSENEKGMIGTYIVCLPSQHEGGDVLLSFGSQVNRASTAPTSKFDLTTISWFSDVTHEVTKLTAGYRLVLTYKLFVTTDASLSASTVLEETERLKYQLSRWKSQPFHYDKIMYPLDHLYTETSLCLANLKGRDRAVVYSLDKICSEVGFYLLFGHTTHARTEEDSYSAYDDEEQDHGTTLRSLHTPTGEQVASGVTIDTDEILGYSIDNEYPDSEDGGEYTGNENAPVMFRYHKTVVVLVPKDRLREYLVGHSRFTDLGATVKNDSLAEIVFQDLSNNENDPYTIQAAIAFMSDLLGFSIKPTGPTVGLISKWALKLNDITTFRACIRATCAPLGSGSPRVNDTPLIAYRKAISDELSSYLKTTSDGQEQSIDWNYWLQDLDQANNVATEVDAFCTAFKSSTEHQPLLASFKAWADPICDRKLKTKSQWTLSDQDYLFSTLKSRSAESEWALQSFLPMAVPRFDRSLLWELLHSISQERYGAFKNSKELYRCMIEHGRGQLNLCGNDIIAKPDYSNRGYGYWNPRKRFVMLLEESYMNGAGQEALGLLEQSCRRLVDERQIWSSVYPHDLRADFLKPLVLVLESYSVPPVPPVQDFFEVALRDVFHRSIMPRPVQLNGWAHEKVTCSTGPDCSTCRELNSFLEDPIQKEWHFPAEECWRQHIESQLRDPIYSLQTLKVRSPHTLVVTKLGKNYDKALRLWTQAVQQVGHSVSWMKRGYLRSLLGEHKYSELIMLDSPSPENAGATRQGEEHSEQPDAKRMRLS